MEKEFCTYEQAVALKELGFDEPCIAIYSNANPKTGLYTLKKYRLKLIKQASQKDKGVKAPLYQQAFRWFRDVHKLWGYQIPWSGNMYCMQIWRLIEDSETVKTIQDRVIMNTWEEAELECLTKLIEIVKSKSNEKKI
jgi:hypothetical protein